MDEKKQLYTIAWTQTYPEWMALQEAITEMHVENSDLEEARDVIACIMAL